VQNDDVCQSATWINACVCVCMCVRANASVCKSRATCQTCNAVQCSVQHTNRAMLNGAACNLPNRAMLCSAACGVACMAQAWIRPAPAHKGVDALELRKSLVITSMAHLRTQDHVYLSMGVHANICHFMHVTLLQFLVCRFSNCTGSTGFPSDSAVSNSEQNDRKRSRHGEI